MLATAVFTSAIAVVMGKVNAPMLLGIISIMSSCCWFFLCVELGARV
jgi:hypothetical protein